jgi:hypothetical protein
MPALALRAVHVDKIEALTRSLPDQHTAQPLPNWGATQTLPLADF